jgi:hypothetical protein
MNKMKKTLVAGALTAGLIGGGAAGAILGSSGVSGAQDSGSASTATAAPAPSSSSGDTQNGTQRTSPTQHFEDALAPLVKAGTITQAQADAVVKALADAGPPAGDHGGRGGRHGGPGLAEAATALGVSEADLRAELQNGATIAKVAQAKGVDVQKVIDAMVAGFKAHLAQEVTSGEHTQAEADQKLADATQRITDMVNNGAPQGGPGGPGGRDGSSQAPTTGN